MRRALFLLGLIAMVGVAAGAAAISQLELTDPQELLQTSYICTSEVDAGGCTAEGAMAQLSQDANRTYIPLDEMPEHLVNAVIAVEDRNFWEHQGVSVPAIARAIYQDTFGSGVQQGGSTITQQYVKNVYLNDERSYDRKLREAVLAMKLEQQTPKEEILEGYLNTIWLGRQSIGVQGASQVYFNKDVQNLEVHESALLAGLIRAPGAADPSEHPEEANRRRETALQAMYEEEYITEDEMTLANADDWGSIVEYDGHQVIETFKGAEVGTEYVTGYVRAQLQREPFNYTPEEIDGGGLRVYTSLDMDLQTAAYQTIYNDVLNQEGDPPASLVSLDDAGRIKAMVGGPGFDDREWSQNNLATTGRQVGSIFKPVALAAVVQDSYSLTESTLQSPGRFDNIYAETEYEPLSECGQEWSVGNYDDTPHTGRMDLLAATAASSNTAYAQIMMELGTDRVWDMAEDLGMGTRPEDFGQDPPCPPTVLGTENSSALEMAEIYSTFANHGIRYEPQIITRVERVDADGNVEIDWEDDSEGRENQVLTEGEADLMTHSLRGAVEDGTATAAQIEGRQTAGKTGTTSNNKDAWFVGYVPEFTTSVWMGYPVADWEVPDCDPNNLEEGQPEDCLEVPPMNETAKPVHGVNVTGGSFPAEIWQRYMVRALEGVEPQEFAEPNEEQLAEGRILGQEAPSEAPPPEPPPGDGQQRPPEADPTPEPEPDPDVSIPEDPLDPCQSDNPPDYCSGDGGGGGDDGGGGDGGVDCDQQPWHPRCSDEIDICPPDDPTCTEVDGAALLLVPLAFANPLRRRLRRRSLRRQPPQGRPHRRHQRRR